MDPFEPTKFFGSTALLYYSNSMFYYGLFTVLDSNITGARLTNLNFNNNPWSIRGRSKLTHINFPQSVQLDFYGPINYGVK